MLQWVNKVVPVALGCGKLTKMDIIEAIKSKPLKELAVSQPYGDEYLAGRRIGSVMRVTLGNLRNALKQRLALEGIPWSVWYFLRTLWEEDGLTQRELTARVGMTQPTTLTALRTRTGGRCASV